MNKTKKTITFAAIKTFEGFQPRYESDKEFLKPYKIGDAVMLRVLEKGEPRSYQQLKMYKAALKVVVSNTDNPLYNTPEKLDILLKIKHGFIEDKLIYGKENDRIQYIPKSLSYAKAAHKDATQYINAAMETMARILETTPQTFKANLGNL